MNRYIKRGMIAALAGGWVAGYAQESDNSRLEREMTLEREYAPAIQDANKVSLMPEIKAPEVTKQAIDYSPFTTPAEPEKEITPLPSGDIMTEIPVNQRKGYLHFGAGLFTVLNGDAGYYLLNDDVNRLNLFLSHRSIDGKVAFSQESETRNAKLNDNLGGVRFRHEFKNVRLNLGTDYNHTAFNYYGSPAAPSTGDLFAPSILAPVDRESGQVNQVFNLHGSIRPKGNDATSYLLDVDFFNFNQRYDRTKMTHGVRENHLALQAGVSRRFGSDQNQQAGLNGKADLFNYTNPSIATDSTGYQNSLRITLNPYYRIESEGWKIQGGVHVMLLAGDSTALFLAPHLSAEMQVAERTLLYAAVDGEIRSNDALSLARRNRYMDHLIAVAPSRTTLDATLGVRSNLKSVVWLNVFAGYRITKNEVFFIPPRASRLPGAFDVGRYRYEFNSYSVAFQPDASLFRIGATVKYTFRKQVEFSVKGVYNQWSLKENGSALAPEGDVEAYGRPAVEVNAGVTVRPLSPLTLNLDGYLGAQRYTLLYGKNVKMNDVHDFNFTASWSFNALFGVYVKLNNLLDQPQELFYGYPSLGFHALAGINFNF